MQDLGNGLSVLPTSLYPVSVDSAIPLQYLPDDQLFTSNQGLPESYSFQSVKYQFDNATLDNAKIAQDDNYLQLPGGTTDRTRQLAQDITAGIESPYQQAQAIQDYLKNNYTYDFDFKPAPDGQEPNDWFLFNEKKGVCTNFNSAFVTLARSAGLPSRLVGGYAVKPGIADQQVYADQAHAWSEVEFQDIGWQTFDATGSPPALASTVTNITSVENTVMKGNTFNVQGTVTSPGTTVEGVQVELFVNPNKSQEGGTQVGQGTVTGGAFNIKATIPDSENVGNYQLLAHALNSIQFQESWSDPRIKVTAETRISLDLPARIKLNDPLQLKGTLTETTNNPVGGQPIDISVNGAPLTVVTTDQKGQFTWEYIFDAPGRYTLDTNFNNTEFYLGASNQVSVSVLVPTTITLESPAKASVKQAVSFNGTLGEQTGGNPINNQKISVFINNQPVDKPVITDSNGKFAFQNVFDKAGIYQVEVVSDYTDQYWESRHTAAVEIVPIESQFPWLYLILSVIVLAGGVGFYFLYTRTRFRTLAAAGPSIDTVEVPISPIIPEDNAPKPVLKINFPGINAQFPDVWGINDELETTFKLLNPSGRIISGGELKIHVKDRDVVLTTDEQGTARLLLTFSEKAVYTIEAEYKGEAATRGITSKRTVKIVDYREEIIALFKSLKSWFTEQGLSFPLEATPREIEVIVTASKLNISQDILTRLIDYFEEADYSLHSITRENYLKMYLVQKEIREYVR